ncbi:MAG: hypothetical protein AAFX93_18545 [Verrucomicrobiota bacterium]
MAKAYLTANMSGAQDGDILMNIEGQLVRVSRQAAVAIASAQVSGESKDNITQPTITDVSSAVAGTDGAGGAGDAASKSDVDSRLGDIDSNLDAIAIELGNQVALNAALITELNSLRTEFNKAQNELSAIRDRLKVTGGNGLIED